MKVGMGRLWQETGRGVYQTEQPGEKTSQAVTDEGRNSSAEILEEMAASVTGVKKTETSGTKAGNGEEPGDETEIFRTSFDSLSLSSSQASKGKGSDFKLESSEPEDSVGQLAAMLARAETRLDVQQVNGKALRALASLRMASASSEGDEAKKIAQMIRRMEKLLKRINKKLKHLGNEEQLEKRRAQAEKKLEEKKEELLRQELRTKRKKRRRDEREYAQKEMAEDQKTAAGEATQALTQAAGMSSVSPDAGLPSVDGAMASVGSADVAASPVDAGSFEAMA